ncbi:glycosyltransferase family 4 protein [Niallia circulans]|uniref:glycosyltransferase family 4 protein n=1 Tax=Niallia circulans TaxID=1397 RepID=UPI002E226392|nr:glycosyltransferase family 4 protein [Niallia circulans]
MKKVLLLTNTIAPYRIPVLNKIEENNDYDLTVWYLEEREKNREWNIDKGSINYKYECLNGYHMYIRKLDMGIHINFGLLIKLIRLSPDIIITSGYDTFGYWTALLYCKLFRRKYVVWWGSTLKSSIIKNRITTGIRKFFFRNADSFITYGTDATDCLVHYGVPLSKIVTGYNTVDIKSFYEKYKKYKKYKKNDNNDEQYKLLFIGQLIPRKGLEELLLALVELKDLNWKLNIIGSGPEEGKLKKYVEKSNLSGKVTFCGYKQKEEIYDYLLTNDCLVFPSLREVWGLVVNEAIATNIFVASSIYAGATRDIIVNKENGIIIDPYNKSQLVTSLEWCINNTRKMRINRIKTPLTILKKIHPYNYANSVIEAIKIADK